MKNITEYNEFVKLNKSNTLNEEMDIDTGTYGEGAGPTDDKYFANVKGNLAGAENTLVGAAAIKLFGFIKRKGLQMYMKKVLKPRLGRAYMNGILRYSNKNGIGNFARKQQFEIDKVSDKKRVQFEQEVSFILNDVNGISSFKKGAEVNTSDGNPLADGQYILKYNDGQFVCKDGKITKIEEGFQSETPKTPTQAQPVKKEVVDEVDTNISEDEFEKYKKEIESDISELEKTGVKAEQWVIDEYTKIKEKVNIDNINDDEDISTIVNERKNLLSGVKTISKGIKEIDVILSKGKENVANYDEVRYQKLVFTANMNQLLSLAEHLNSVVNTYKNKSSEKAPVAQAPVAQTPTPTPKPVVAQTESLIIEADAPVVVDEKKKKKKKKKSAISPTRLGDELQEIANSGDAIDLNNENFYKQFEDEKHRKGVTDEILLDKPTIAKVQLDAERIIGGNDKQQNAWDKMVEDVKSKYSKFMDTGDVDPKVIRNNTPDLEKLKKENDRTTNGKNTKGIITKYNLEQIPLWEENTNNIKSLGNNFKDNDYLITMLTINKVANNYVLQRIKEINGLFYYRVLGLINKSYILENKEQYIKGTKTDFSEEVLKIGKFGKIIGPDSPTREGGRNIAVYIVSNTKLNFGNNSNISLLYLYTTSSTGGVNFENETTFYTVKRNDKNMDELRLPKSPLTGKDYTFSLEVLHSETTLITYPNTFGIDTNQKFDISKSSSIKKMNGINTIYEDKK